MGLEIEELAEAAGLGAADRNVGGAAVVHAELVAGLEPRDNFLDVIDVYEKTAVYAPEALGVEGLLEVLEGAVIGGAFELSGIDGDKTVVDGSEDHFIGVDEQKPLTGFHQQLDWRSGAGAQALQKTFQAPGVGGLRAHHLAGASKGATDAGFVKGLEQIVHGADFEGFERIVIVGSGEDHVRERKLFFDKLAEDAEAIEAGHFDIEEDNVGAFVLDEGEGFEAVAGLADNRDVGEPLEEKDKLIASGLLVVHYEGGNCFGHRSGFSIGADGEGRQIELRAACYSARR